MEELANAVSRVVDLGDDSAGEDSQSYSIEIGEPSLEEIEDLVEAVIHLSEYIETGRVTVHIDGESDGYQIQYNPSEDTIVAEQVDGQQYDPGGLYQSDPDLAGSLQELTLDTISGVEEIFSVLNDVYEHQQYFEISTSYNLRKSNIEASIAESATIDVAPTVFFSLDRLINEINNQPPEAFRQKYLDESPRCVFSILETETVRFSSAIGISSIASTEEVLSQMEQSELDWEEKTQEIATTALIENVGAYLPPSVFQLQSITNDSELRLNSLFHRHQLLFSLLAIASNSRNIREDEWNILIQGKQFVEGHLSFPDATSVEVDETDSIELSDKLIGSVVSLYDWVYSEGRSENRADILRNVVTLYARSLSEVIEDAQVIESSARSNLRYYRRESVDDFVDFRQEMIEGAIQTQSQLSELRSELMSGISRDLFRTFGFIIAISAGLVIRVNEVLGENAIFAISSMIVGGYTLITHRRIKGIEKQYVVQTENHKNLETFYDRFFDENELQNFGVKLSEESPTLLDSCILPDQGNDKMTRRFRRDLAMYYFLLGGMGILAVILLLALLVP